MGDGMGENSQKSRQNTQNVHVVGSVEQAPELFVIAISTSCCVHIVMENTLHVLKKQIVLHNVVSELV